MEVGTEQTGMIKFVFKKGKLVLVMKLGDDGKLIWRGIAKVVNRAKVYKSKQVFPSPINPFENEVPCFSDAVIAQDSVGILSEFPEDCIN